MQARYTLTHSHTVPMTVLFPTFSSPFSARSLALVGSGHVTLRHLACRLVSTRFHQSAKSGSDASARHVRTKKAEPQSSLAAAPLRPQHSLGVPALWQGSTDCSYAIAALPACLSTDLASMTNHDDSECDSYSDSSFSSHLEYPQQKLLRFCI